MQVDVDTSLAFGTAKNVQIGSSVGGTGELSPNTTLNTRSTAQLSSSTLSTRKIGRSAANKACRWRKCFKWCSSFCV